MRFAVCTSIDREPLAELVGACLGAVCAQAQVDTFSSLAALCQAEDLTVWSVLLLDAQLLDAAGLALAQRLQRLNPVCQLLLLGNSRTQALPGFALHPADFLLRPFGPARLFAALERCRDSWADALRRLEFSMARVQCSVALYDILYVQLQDRKCLVHLRSWEPQLLRMTMGQLEQRLDDAHFFRCHRSFLVNLCHAVRLDPQAGFTLSNGVEIPVGRDRMALAEAAFCRQETENITFRTYKDNIISGKS